MLPIFLAVLVAIFDAAHFMAVYVGLANGVSSGARVASIPTASNSSIQNAVTQFMVMADTAAIQSSVTVVPAVRTAGGNVTVTASAVFTFDPIVGALLDTVGAGTVTVTQRATTIVEGP